ncbi:MAG: flippase [Planctomycetota bacterium]
MSEVERSEAERDSPKSGPTASSDNRSILKNFGWLSSGRFLTLLISLPISILVARHLGPKDFGVLSYSLAIVNLLTPLTGSGLNSIVVRNTAREGRECVTTMGSASVLQSVGGMFTVFLAPLVALALRPDDPLVLTLVAVASARNVFSVANVFDYHFQAKSENQKAVKSRLTATIATAVVKVLLVALQMPLLFFAAASSLEAAITAILFYAVYRSSGNSVRSWKVDRGTVANLLRESWPLTVTGFAIIAQAYVDQVMLGEMKGDEAVGQYSVAIRLISVIGFAGLSLQKALAPSIAKAKKAGLAAYRSALSKQYQLCVLLFLAQAIPTFLFAELAVRLLYGEAFSEAGRLLPWLAIRLFFSNFGIARSTYIANESLFRHSMMTAFAGLATNAVANLFLIPAYGATGAIVGTVLSFIVTTFLIDGIVGRTRENFYLMVKAPLDVLRNGFAGLKRRMQSATAQ